MSMNGLSLSPDCTIHITEPNGTDDITAIITNFQSKPNTTTNEVAFITGETKHLRWMKGWSGSFQIARQNAFLDNLWDRLEAGYYAGNNEANITITQTIKEPDGSISQFQFVNIMLDITDNGTFQADSAVMQSVSFNAQRRLKVA